jgi:tetratricopeptide (TPR) repeat protein
MKERKLIKKLKLSSIFSILKLKSTWTSIFIIFLFLLLGICGYLCLSNSPGNWKHAPYVAFAQEVQRSEENRLATPRQTLLTEPEEDYNITCLEGGKELFWQQEYNEAIEHLEQCLKRDPENPEIYYYIGQAYFQQGQQAAQHRNIKKATRFFRQAFEVSDTAIEKYQKKITENPAEDHTNDYLQLAYIYQIRSLIPGVDEYQEALNIYQKLLTEKPRLTYVYYHMGWIYYQLADYYNAIETYLKYLESGAKSDFVYYYLGLCYDKIGEREEAEYYFQLILKEFPDTDIAKRAKKELN